jgi:RNA polymerase II-associated protein 3
MKDLSDWQNSQSKPSVNNLQKLAGEKIKSFEYEKWDKFNVEEALENVDKEMRSNPQKELKSLFEKEKGNAYFSKGKLKKSIQCYTKSINLNPNAAASYLNRALAFLKLNMYIAI